MSEYPICFGVRRTPQIIEKNLCGSCNFEDYCSYVCTAGLCLAEKDREIQRLQTQVAELQARCRG